LNSTPPGVSSGTVFGEKFTPFDLFLRILFKHFIFFWFFDAAVGAVDG